MEKAYIRFSPYLEPDVTQLATIDIPKESIFIDHASLKDKDRPELKKLLAQLSEGDHIFVQSLDRLARDIKELSSHVDTIFGKNASLEFVKEHVILSKDPAKQSCFSFENMLDLLAEWQKAVSQELTNENKAAARIEGKHFGRPSSVTDEQREMFISFILEPKQKSVLHISRLTGIPRSTCYRMKDQILKALDEIRAKNNLLTKEQEASENMQLIKEIKSHIHP